MKAFTGLVLGLLVLIVPGVAESQETTLTGRFDEQSSAVPLPPGFEEVLPLDLSEFEEVPLLDFSETELVLDTSKLTPVQPPPGFERVGSVFDEAQAECLLENLKGVQSNTAAQLVFIACITLHPFSTK